MPVTRRYLCDDCGFEWTKLHFDRDDPVPECASCAGRAQSIPGMFAINGVKSKAIDYTYKMAETDYGMTNMRSGAYEGEAYALPPSPVQAAEREQLTRAMIETVQGEATVEIKNELAGQVSEFWKTGHVPAHPLEQAKIQEARQSAPAAASAGMDPIGLLHQGQKATGGGMKLDVVSRAKIN